MTAKWVVRGGGQNLENFVGNMGVDNMEGWGRALHKIGS